MNRVVLSQKSDHWQTPPALMDSLSAEFGQFDFDPCALGEKGEFGWLNKRWTGKVFCNPPYSEVAKWVGKAWHETMMDHTNAELVVCLLPARTDTKWFHGFCYGFEGSPEIRFIKGRLKFSGAKHNCPFPSMLVIFRRNTKLSPHDKRQSVEAVGATANQERSFK